MKFKNHSFGFTLIELMVVIVIIAILATLGLVTYQNALRRTHDTKQIADMKEILSSQEQFKSLYGAYSCGGATACTALGSTSCPTMIGTQFDFPESPSDGSYACNVTNNALCVASDVLERGDGNCSGCSSAGVMNTSGTLNKYCVIGKQ